MGFPLTGNAIAVKQFARAASAYAIFLKKRLCWPNVARHVGSLPLH